MTSFAITMIVGWSLIGAMWIFIARNLIVAGKCTKATHILQDGMRLYKAGEITWDQWLEVKARAKKAAGKQWEKC